MRKHLKNVYQVLKRIPNFLKKGIWDQQTNEQRGARGLGFVVLKIGSIVHEGVIRNKIPSHAAALSYYSLMSLGPLIALAVMISGFVIQYNDDEYFAAKTLNRLIYFIAPSLQISSEKQLEEGEIDVSNAQTDTLQQAPLNPELINFIERMIKSTRSGAVGLVGSLMLIIIVIQLFVVIEKTFNIIWGVRRGRPLIKRIVFYWTMLSLGAVLGFAAVSTLTATTIAEFFGKLPLGSHVVKLLDIIAPIVSSAILVLLLGIFYRFIPNTRVRWMPALIGALFVSVCLFLNNYLSFIYINRVIQAQSLYGSISIIFILIFGLYVFWLLILLGGQITYSVQNVNFVAIQKVWNNVSFKTQELLSLALLVHICRRFKKCEKPPSTEALNSLIQAPRRVLNETLVSLEDLGWIHEVRSEEGKDEYSKYWQPARPLNTITLGAFKKSFEDYGNNVGVHITQTFDDPILQYYQKTFTCDELEGANFSIEALINKLSPASP